MTSPLQQLAQRRAGVRSAEEERCELCAEPLQSRHRHLLDVRERRLLCACRACSILFDRSGAGGGHYRLVPDRARFLDGFDLDDGFWRSLAIPVDLAFFFESTAAGRVVALYPSPAGATESLLPIDAWEELVARNPVLTGLEADVEALLVDRTRAAPEHWLLPIDRCYELVGLLRTRWQGFTGGDDVWRALGEYFDELRKEATWESRSESRT